MLPRLFLPFAVLLAISLSARADVVPQRINGPLAGAGGPHDTQTAVWIVQLRGPAAMQGKRRALPTIADKTRRRESMVLRDKPSVAAAATGLTQRHEAMLAQVSPGKRPLHSYRYAFNGFSAVLTGAEAAALRALPDVAAVYPDAERQLSTDSSPQFLGLFDAKAGLVSVEGLSGDGVVIAVIDSGITPESESFRDTRPADSPRACRSSWGQNSLLGRWLCRSYRRKPDQLLFTPLEGWAGACEAGEAFSGDECNNKLIGARFYSAGAEALGAFDAGEFLSPRDADGHGTHIAATAAGNRIKATLRGSEIATVRGIAPGARIAAYKACWLRPGSTRASCQISDLVQAIDDAVADGADIINYSIGNTEATIANADDVALLEANKAGVLTIVAAGNDGPALGSIGSPAGSPWALTVAASSRTGQRFVEAIAVTAPASLAGRYPSAEARFTPSLRETGSISGRLVAADDADDSNGSRFDACQPLANDDEANDAVVLIARGGCDFDVKVANAEDAGAVAAIVFNNLGGPVIMVGDRGDISIPAVSIGQADGQQLLDALNAGDAITVELANGLFLSEPEDGNLVGNFSSRGPSTGAPNILKPDVSAPGINILAALSPDAANSVSDQRFGYLTGTSMAAPHVAGVAALLKERYPNWSPAALRSALMTSARQDLLQADGVTAANPFERGAGHIVPNEALNPGLVYDVSAEQYDAFTCSDETFPISRSRCDALTASGLSDDPSQLNQPAIAAERLTLSQTFTRTVTATEAGSWVARLLMPAGFTGDVQPATLNLAEGESTTVEVTIGAAEQTLDLWYFGALEWVSGERVVHSPVAVRPVQVAAPDEVSGAGGSGSVSFDVRFGYSGNFRTESYGLKPAVVTRDFVADDPSKNFTRRTNNGVTAFSLQVPPDQLFLRVALFDDATDGDDDLDLYVYYCPTDTSCRKLAESGEPTSNESIDIPGPEAGLYEIYVHGFATDNDLGGSGAIFDLHSWLIGPADRGSNLNVDAPSLVSAGGSETLTASWQNLTPEQRYLGVIFHIGPAGLAALTLVSVIN